MGVIALGAAAVIAGGAAAYGANEKNKSAKKQAGATNAHNENVLSTWTDIEKENSKIYSQIAQAIPDLNKLNLGPATAGFTGYNQQRPYINNVSTTARTIDRAANKNFQSSLSETSPDLLPAISALSTRAREFLSGNLPPDVEKYVTRKAAERAASGGFGIESGMGRNLVSRDLGLTSLDLMKTGASMVPSALSTTAAVNPFQTNVQSLFFTPEYLQNRADAQASTNWTVGNENKNRQFQRISGILASKLKSMPPLYRESIPETTNPVVAGIGAAASTWMSGGLTGGGGGSGTGVGGGINAGLSAGGGVNSGINYNG